LRASRAARYPGAVVIAHVLVIDDPETAARTASVLEARGHRAFVYGSRAWLAADAFRPDVVLLDLGVRRHDGSGLATTLRAHSAFRDVPVVLTGDDDPADEEVLRAMRHAQAYVRKPFDVDELEREIRRLVNAGRSDETTAP
jgi:DNA-binding response OmpR family regulator